MCVSKIWQQKLVADLARVRYAPFYEILLVRNVKEVVMSVRTILRYSTRVIAGNTLLNPPGRHDFTIHTMPLAQRSTQERKVIRRWSHDQINQGT